MDWGQAIANGFATGTGVIFAQKFINWFDNHYMIRKVKRTMDTITLNKENDDGINEKKRFL